MKKIVKTTQDNSIIQDNNTIDIHNKCAKLEHENQELKAKLNWYEEQYRLSKHNQFGRSSEQTNTEQLTLFNEAEDTKDSKIEEPVLEEIIYKRRKKKRTDGKSFDHLPLEIIEYKLKDEECICPQCQGSLHEMSKEVRKELKVIPAQVKIVHHVRYIYACRRCQREDIETPIITAPMPKPVLPSSFVSPSLMAFIMEKKYSQAIPLYRQEKQWQHFGIDLSRQNLSNWMIHGANNWLIHIYRRLHEHLVNEDILHGDETTLQVLKEDGRSAQNKSYIWLFATGKESTPIYLYEYQTTRASKHPRRFLQGFKGYLHTDGYAGYNDIPGVKIVGCMAHARRKFTDCLKALPKEASLAKTTAGEGLNYINKFFEIERQIADLSPEERYIQRQKQSKPELDAFLAWLKTKQKQSLPKSTLGIAIKYCLNQWRKLVTYVEDGRLEISNNRGERAIKPFVIGRKNWLFSITPKGASSSAIIYSIIETAKANGLSPFHYLNYLFEKLPNIDITNNDQLDKLLPWSKELSKECKPQNKNNS